MDEFEFRNLVDLVVYAVEEDDTDTETMVVEEYASLLRLLRDDINDPEQHALDILDDLFARPEVRAQDVADVLNADLHTNFRYIAKNRDHFKAANEDVVITLTNDDLKTATYSADNSNKLWQWSYVPPGRSLGKIGEQVTDTIRPYQNKNQFTQDLLQPLAGVVRTGLGLLKTGAGFLQLFTGKLKPFTDGLATLARGLFEVASAPLAWTVKPLIRGVSTLVSKPGIDAELRRSRLEFTEFVTKNPHCFEENTYFLASMTLDPYNQNNDVMKLYPGAGSKFRQGANIPWQFRDPKDTYKIHPDLDIKIRQKAHRVFHEQILGHKISIFQTLMANESALFFESRGGGAKLKNGKLEANFKSGVLNGKWGMWRHNGKKLEYGELRHEDRQRFEVALAKLNPVNIDPEIDLDTDLGASSQSSTLETGAYRFSTPSSLVRSLSSAGFYSDDRPAVEQPISPDLRNSI